jgi:glycosyltransferase involved in cell wall biosynthesis
MMKIAIVDQPFGHIDPGKHSGSIDTLIYEIARRAARTAAVTVYVKRGPGQSMDEVAEGVRYKRFDLSREERINRLTSRLLRWQKPTSPWFLSRLYYRSYIHAISADLVREKCDIVHLHTFPQFATVVRAKNPRAKIILHMHCEWLTQLDHSTIDKHLRSVDRVISCSDFITNGVRNHFPHYANRCTTVPNGADAEYLASIAGFGDRTNGQAKTILYVGRISPEKGLHVLVDAFKVIARYDPYARLDFVGPEGVVPRSFICDLSDEPMVRDLAPLCQKGYLDALRERVPEDLRERVRFLGEVPYSQVREHYARACIAVNPSICQEAFGMPVAEAMMGGLPVVVTDAGGMPELVVNGKTGFVVQRNDPKALADAMVMLLQDAVLRDRMGQAGKERAMGLYTWEKVAKRMLEEYRNLHDGSLTMKVRRVPG